MTWKLTPTTWVEKAAKVTVSITGDANTGYKVVCDPDVVQVPEDGGPTLLWEIKTEQRNDWEFAPMPLRFKAHNGKEAQFKKLRRHNTYKFWALGDDERTYIGAFDYIVTVKPVEGGQPVSSDPSVKNGSGKARMTGNGFRYAKLIRAGSQGHPKWQKRVPLKT